MKMSDFESRFKELNRRVAIDEHNASVHFDVEKCKNCTMCRRQCASTMSVTDYYYLQSTGDVPICVHCGQCSAICPFGATTAVSSVEDVKAAIADKNYTVIFQTAPAVRVSLGESFGMPFGTFVEGKMVAALRALGADYVFDTCTGADLTIMEEASELVHRLEYEKDLLPQFTSCCPAWVEFAEIFFPEMIPHLSTSKSPISMLAPMIKTYFAKNKQIDPSKIVSVCVTPCTAKKTEILRPEMNASAQFWDIPSMRDTDLCITTRELANWIKESGIDFASLQEEAYDDVFGKASGSGIIFGSTGGVMESALRTAYYLKNGETAPADFMEFKPIRGLNGVKEAEVPYGNKILHVAAVNGLSNVRLFIHEMEEDIMLGHYSFIEVMACPGGCIGGGGQPHTKLPQTNAAKQSRSDSLYKRDLECSIRSSWQNPDIKKLYSEFLMSPLSPIAESMLHTSFKNKHYRLGSMDDITPQTCPTSPQYKEDTIIK
jgi:NADH-quinone oxidoreductase subunit G